MKVDSPHHRSTSSLGDLSFLELDRHEDDDTELEVHLTEKVEENDALPISSLVLVTETENLESDAKDSSILQEIVADVSDFDNFTLEHGKIKISNWGRQKFYSDYIKQGIEWKAKHKDVPKQQADTQVVMLFESPSSSTTETSFHNAGKFKFHDWPPPTSTLSKSVLGPCKYASMNGSSLPVFLKDGHPPAGLVEHWAKAIPGFKPPTYVDKITDDNTVYAYLPVEQIQHHVNDPDVHYHLVGKDAIHMMTQKTTRLLENTHTVRPCVVKTTHSMGSKGIFIIQNDEDEKEFEQFLHDSGRPTFVVTDFVDIARNVACHFFMHPNGTSITWFGSNENHREPDGSFSSDSYLLLEHQEKLQEIQLPFVEEVVQYCHGLGYWGFCGVDVLFDSQDRGYLVDINPRVTGSCPAIMALHLLSDKYGFQVGLFRRSGENNFMGSPAELLEQVSSYNSENEGSSHIIIHSLYQPKGKAYTKVNIGVYGNSLSECKTVLNRFAGPIPSSG